MQQANFKEANFVKTDLISEGVPTIHYGEMYTHYGPLVRQNNFLVSEELLQRRNSELQKKIDVVIVAGVETMMTSVRVQHS